MAINKLEEILSFHDGDIKKIMQNIDPVLMAKVLTASSEELQDKIFKNISENAVQQMKDDMKYMGVSQPDDEYIVELKDDMVKIINRLFPDHLKCDAGHDEWA